MRRGGPPHPVGRFPSPARGGTLHAVPPPSGDPAEAVLAAVLAALAGARWGDRVAGVGTGPRTTAALLAMCGATALADGDARVVVAGSASDVPLAVGRLAPGGRLVAVAADAGAAQRVAGAYQLELRHVEPIGRGVAWVGVRPLRDPS